MVFRIMNEDLDEKFHFPETFVLKEHGKFKQNGNIFGMYIGSMSQYQNISNNSIAEQSEKQDELFRELIDLYEHGEVFLIKNEYMNTACFGDPDFNENLDIPFQMVRYTAYYMPYMAEGHSAWKPTCNLDSIDKSLGDDCEFLVTLEILFVWQDKGIPLNRYFTKKTKCGKDESVIRLFSDFMDNIGQYIKPECPSVDSLKKEDLLGADYEGKFLGDLNEINTDDGFLFDFYDALGNRQWLYFESVEALKDTVSGFRVVDFMTLEPVKTNDSIS